MITHNKIENIRCVAQCRVQKAPRARITSDLLLGVSSIWKWLENLVSLVDDL